MKSNDDRDGEGNSKLRRKKTTILHVNHTFWFISLKLLHDWNDLDLTFYCDVYKGRNFTRLRISFSLLSLDVLLKNSIPHGTLTFNKSS